MGKLDSLFADLLAPDDSEPTGTPGDIGDIGDKARQCSRSERSSSGDTVATSGDTDAAPVMVSPLVASLSPASNRAASRANARLSPMSPMSPASRMHALSPTAADRCHWPPWSEGEIATFVRRVSLFMRRGVSAPDADDLAEALVLRDRDGDDRRTCVECAHGAKRRCAGGGPLPADVLHRCGAFRAAS